MWWWFSEYVCSSANTWYVRDKKDECTDYVFNWKQNGLYTSKLKPLYTAFLHNITLSGYKVRIKIDKDPLAVEQSSYIAKIVNAFIIYDLDAWTNNALNNFKLKTC